MHIEQSTSDILLFEYLSSTHPASSAHITSNMVHNMSPSQHTRPVTRAASGTGSSSISECYVNPILNCNANLRSPNTADTTSQNALTLIQHNNNNYVYHQLISA